MTLSFFNEVIAQPFITIFITGPLTFLVNQSFRYMQIKVLEKFKEIIFKVIDRKCSRKIISIKFQYSTLIEKSSFFFIFTRNMVFSYPAKLARSLAENLILKG